MGRLSVVIIAGLAVALILGGCALPTAPVSPLPVPQRNIVEPMPEPSPGDELLAWLNAARNGAGLGPLTQDERLFEAAIEFAKESAERDYCGTRDAAGRGPAARARANGYDPLLYGEVAVCGCTTPYRAVNAWLRNEEQRAIVLDARAVDAGVGWYVNEGRCRVVLDVGAERAQVDPPVSPLPTPAATPVRVWLAPVSKQ